MIYVLYISFIETCSWRADSTRCYPGTCSNEIATTCKCLDGFGGHHCDQSKRISISTNYSNNRNLFN